MRSAIVGSLALVACSPEIAPGAYLCGPEQLCPAGQACDGADTVCVLAGEQAPFDCGESLDAEPNNAATTAQRLGTLACVSSVIEARGCLMDNDPEDWFAFDVPANCTGASATLRVIYPIAFEPPVFDVRAGDGTVAGAGALCDGALGSDGLGTDAACLVLPVTSGGHYNVRIAHSGEANCAGSCAFNRYVLDFQLTMP